MNPIDIIIAVIILIIVGGAVYYIYRAKKDGQKCIGCPYSKECGKEKCSCQSVAENNN